MVHEKNFPFHEPEQETEIIHVYQGAGWGGKFTKIIIIMAIGAGLFLGAKYLFELGRGGANGGMAVIEANPEPYKSAPDDPGGMDIPNIDKEIYSKVKQPFDDTIDANEVPEPPNDALAQLTAEENKENEFYGKTENPEIVGKVPEPKSMSFNNKGQEIKSGQKIAVPSSSSLVESRKAKRIDVEKVLAKKNQSEIWLQLGTFKSEDEATHAWQDTREKNTDLLSDMTIKVTKSDMKDQGVLYRLQAGPANDEGQAKDYCRKLAARKQNCFYTVYKNNE